MKKMKKFIIVTMIAACAALCAAVWPHDNAIEYSARDCAPQPLKLSIHSGGIEHPCRCR